MRLREWAEAHSVSYWTALRWFHAGSIPGAVQMPTGTIVIEEPVDAAQRELVGYARVSSSNQKEDLVRQAQRLRDAGAQRVVSEVGSGLDGHRRKLMRLLEEDVDIVVEHRERLVRFGFEYIESAIAPRRVVVLDSAEMDDDLVRDVTDVLTSLCARLYGKRSARNRARKAVSACVSTD